MDNVDVKGLGGDLGDGGNVGAVPLVGLKISIKEKRSQKGHASQPK